MTGFAREAIDASLAQRLIAAQFPRWAHLPVRRVPFDGWDNRTFRLGNKLKLRLPTGPAYAPQVEKERLWLPRLAPHLPLPIPEPVATGAPGCGYPWAWSVQRWIDGEIAAQAPVPDLRRFAGDLACFLAALQRIDVAGAPPPGAHNFHRGGRLAVYDGETRAALSALGAEVDGAAALEVWEAALASAWRGPPVWVHGDVSSGNLLVRDGRLAALLDFGSSAAGDPACDLYIAWTFLDAGARSAFRAALPLDADTWARGRGWTLWKALIRLAAGDAAAPEDWQAVLATVIADHRR